MKLANNLDTIPAPLLDCIEVLEVSGYISEEKAVIATSYLGPQAKDAPGWTRDCHGQRGFFCDAWSRWRGA